MDNAVSELSIRKTASHKYIEENYKSLNRKEGDKEMKQELIDATRSKERLDLSEKRCKKLFSAIFDELSGLSTYLQLHSVNPDHIDTFLDNLINLTEEFDSYPLTTALRIRSSQLKKDMASKKEG